MIRCLLLILLISAFNSFGQDKDSSYVRWMTWEEAVVAATFSPRPVMVFIESEGNPECLKMDSVAFQDTIVQWYLNNAYYSVRLDAHTRDTIIYKRKHLVYRDYEKKDTGYHDLAAGLLQHEFNFPAFVVLNRNFKRINKVSGYFNTLLFTNFLDFYSDESNWVSSPMAFGRADYQCTNPNHPHNRLRAMEAERLKREGRKKDK